MTVGMVGRTYLEDGAPVEVLIQPYEKRSDLPRRRFPLARTVRRAPRNVAIRRSDGTVVVRPLRGLHRPPDSGDV